MDILIWQSPGPYINTETVYCNLISNGTMQSHMNLTIFLQLRKVTGSVNFIVVNLFGSADFVVFLFVIESFGLSESFVRRDL